MGAVEQANQLSLLFHEADRKFQIRTTEMFGQVFSTSAFQTNHYTPIFGVFEALAGSDPIYIIHGIDKLSMTKTSVMYTGADISIGTRLAMENALRVDGTILAHFGITIQGVVSGFKGLL